VAGKILKFADDTKIYHAVYSDEDVSGLSNGKCFLMPINVSYAYGI